MQLTDIPNKVLADMVRSGTYTAGTNIDGDSTKFLLVFAGPYGPADDVYTLREAFKAFQEFISDYDWEERQIQVLTVENGQPHVIEESFENMEAD